MRRILSLAALSLVVLSATLLLRAQPLPQPTPPGSPAPAADPFAPAPAAPGVDPFGAPAPAPGVDPFAPAPPAPAVDPFGAPVPPAQPALPVPAPAKPMGKVKIPLHEYAEYAANSFLVNLYNNALPPVVVPYRGLIDFADDGLAEETVKKMTPAERMAYHLDRPARIDCFDDKLEHVVEALTRKFQVHVELDRKALEESAFDTATPITFQMVHAAKLGGTLRRLLHGYSLDYVRLDDTLLITSKTRAEDFLFTKTINLDRDVFRSPLASLEAKPANALAAGASVGGGGPAGGGLGGAGAGAGGSFGYVVTQTEEEKAEDQLIKLVELVEPESWNANGGRGDLHLDLRRGILVVRNTQPILEEVMVLLADLRKSLQSHRTAVLANAQLERRVVHRIKLPQKQAGPAQPLEGGGLYTPLEPAFTMQELADLIKQQVEPHTWKDEKHSITILGENLIINQTEATQAKINSFLRELKITREQFEENNRYYGGVS